MEVGYAREKNSISFVSILQEKHARFGSKLASASSNWRKFNHLLAACQRNEHLYLLGIRKT